MEWYGASVRGERVGRVAWDCPRTFETVPTHKILKATFFTCVPPLHIIKHIEHFEENISKNAIKPNCNREKSSKLKGACNRTNIIIMHVVLAHPIIFAYSNVF